MKIDATVHAADAPLVERAIVYTLAFMLAASGGILVNAYPIAPYLIVAGLWLWLVSPFLLRRRRAFRAVLDPGAGTVTIRRKLRPPRAIHTRELAGASVARTERGAVVTLSPDGGRQPIAIEVAGVDEVNELRKSLGIPHGGFGEIVWSAEPKPSDYFLVLVRVLASLAWVLEGMALVAGSTAMTAAAVVPAMALTGIAVIFAASGTLFTGRLIRMNAEELATSTSGRTIRRPWRSIDKIDCDDHGIVIREREARAGLVIPCPPTEWVPSGMRSEERDLMLAQLRGAVAAANGDAAPFVDPASHLDQLRRTDNSAAEWLTRIDAIASLQTSSAYRGIAIAKDDLWRALESHDVSTDLRAGAARILLRVSPEEDQERIARAIDSIHDGVTRKQIRAALKDDAREAAIEIERAAAEAEREALVDTTVTSSEEA